MSQPYGFLDYGESDAASCGGINSVILSAQLTSAAELAAAGGVTLGTAPTFDSVRGMIGNGAGGIKWATATTSNAVFAARAAELVNAGTLTMWVEKTMLDRLNVPAAYQALVNFGNSGTYPIIARTTDANGDACLIPSFPANAVGLASDSLGRDDLVRLDISWTGNLGATNYTMRHDFYIDKVLVNSISSSATANWSPTLFTFFTKYWGSSYMAAAAGALYRLQFSTRPIMLCHARPHLNMVAFGDSISCQAGLETNTPLQPNTPVTLGARGDCGFIIGIRRQFAKHHLLPYQLMYAAIGNKTSDFANQITACFTTGKHHPKYATVMFGTNDAGAGDTAATYDTNIRAGLTTLFTTHGLTKVFIIKPPSRVSASQAHKDLITAYGAKIDLMAADYPGLVIIDGLTATGGLTDVASYFGSDGLHLNNKGSKAISDVLNPLVESHLNWTGA